MERVSISLCTLQLCNIVLSLCSRLDVNVEERRLRCLYLWVLRFEISFDTFAALSRLQQLPRPISVFLNQTRAALERGGTGEVQRLVDQAVLPALVGAVLLAGLTLPEATGRPQYGLL